MICSSLALLRDRTSRVCMCNRGEIYYSSWPTQLWKLGAPTVVVCKPVEPVTKARRPASRLKLAGRANSTPSPSCSTWSLSKLDGASRIGEGNLLFSVFLFKCQEHPSQTHPGILSDRAPGPPVGQSRCER